MAKSGAAEKPMVAGHDGQPPVFREVRDLGGEDARQLPPTKNVNCDRVDWLHDQRLLDDRQHAAALRLQTDWQLADMTAYTTASQVGGVTASKLSVADAKLDAMERRNRVLAPLGPRTLIIVDKVVLRNVSLGKAALAAGVKETVALPFLKEGLDQIARGYGL